MLRVGAYDLGLALVQPELDHVLEHRQELHREARACKRPLHTSQVQTSGPELEVQDALHACITPHG